MSLTTLYLPGEQKRARWMRLDTAEILKRFYFSERAILINQAAWIPSIVSIEIKTQLPHLIWQSTQTADALRERVFELRFPARLVEEGGDTPLIALLEETRHAPSVSAFLLSLADVLLPALRDSYRAYLDASDPLADGPTFRFLTLAHAEKEQQVQTLREWADATLAENPMDRDEAIAWSTAISDQLAVFGNIGIDPDVPEIAHAPLPHAKTYTVPDKPARDPKFLPCRFYWPDTIDPAFGYGEGASLQLRSAVSHFNEIWAVETAGIILSAFADVLPWEWITDAARWTYDESRHCRMGYERLMSWGLDPAEIPLGTYIYDSAAGQDPLYRLGMLFFFETKNIKKKPQRTRLFHEYSDAASEHDMDFDWADETIHAGYGKHWLTELLALRGEDPENYRSIRDYCENLVGKMVQTATPDEVAEIKHAVSALLESAQRGLSHK